MAKVCTEEFIYIRSPTDAKENVDRHRSYRLAKGEKSDTPRATPSIEQQASMPTLDEPDKPTSSGRRTTSPLLIQDSTTNAQCCTTKPTFLGGIASGTITSPLGVFSSSSSSQHYIVEKATGRRFIRGKLLGKGGFAKCYEFIDEKSRHKYAGKIIPRARLMKAHQKEKYMQIMREIDLHRCLSHPNIVAFYCYFEDSDNMNIVLELCSRKSLVEMLRIRKALTEPEVRYFMKQMVEGCRYIHSQQIIHRDFKLGNMLLSDIMELKIADFGLATQVTYEGEKKMTVCGTPNYIAPEVLGKKGHSFEVDIWALGCILYALLVGNPPFETTSLKETYSRIMSNRYYIPAHVQLPARSVIRKLLHPEPSKRPNFDQILSEEFFKSGFMPKSLPPQCCEQVPIFASKLTETPVVSLTSINTAVRVEDKKIVKHEKEKKLAETVLGKAAEKLKIVTTGEKAKILDKKMDKIELASSDMLDLKESPVKKRNSKEVKGKEEPTEESESESESTSEESSDSSDSEPGEDDNKEWNGKQIPASVLKQEEAKLALKNVEQNLPDLSKLNNDSDSKRKNRNDIAEDDPENKRGDKANEKSAGKSTFMPFSRQKSKSLEMKKAKEVQNRVQNLQAQFLSEKMRSMAEKDAKKYTYQVRDTEKPFIEDEKFHTDVVSKLSSIASLANTPVFDERVSPSSVNDKQLIPEHLAEKQKLKNAKDNFTAGSKQSKVKDTIKSSDSKPHSSLSESTDDTATFSSGGFLGKRFSSERLKSGEKRDVRKEIENAKQKLGKNAKISPENSVDELKSVNKVSGRVTELIPVPVVYVQDISNVTSQDNVMIEYDKSLKRNVSERNSGRRKKVDDANESAGSGKKMTKQKSIEMASTNLVIPKGDSATFESNQLKDVTNSDQKPVSAFVAVKSTRDKSSERDISPQAGEAAQPRIKLTNIDRSPSRRQASKVRDPAERIQSPPADQQRQEENLPQQRDTSITQRQTKGNLRPISYKSATPVDSEIGQNSNEIERNTSTLQSNQGGRETPITNVSRKPSVRSTTSPASMSTSLILRSLTPLSAGRDVANKSPSEALFATNFHSSTERPGSYALPSGPDDELHKITTSLAQWQASRKPTQVVTPLPGEPLMEEGEGEGEVPLTWDDAEEDVPVATETTLASSQKNVDSTLGPNEEVLHGTVLALYQILKLFSSQNVPARNNPPPVHDISPMYVAKWVDYSNKYGFGYQLSDGAVGVLFNDKTRMILSVNGSQRMVHYSDLSNQIFSFPWDAVPAPYHKKSTLLFHYAQYMDTHLIPGANVSSQGSLGRSAGSVTIPVFLKKWFRANKAIVLFLSNGTLQVNFLHDHTKVIISSVSTEYCVTFINNKRLAVTYNLRNLAQYGCKREMSERLVYARRMMENVINFEGVAV